ncbi:uncharacterized protein LOC128920524 [Zeugodacus cucurbitae]|uniref:uncharacterized protein LOC128920524 n=1 Tax=Zeugodacus cucurbitae TaxID=28588 RepID=UPI0023D936B9|nr:uncharacterized protein LOC128920524 [Zeugodacus cucurbitae]
MNVLKTEKLKKKRCQIISNEMIALWSKLNFPSITRIAAQRKITEVLNDYSTFLKFPDGRNVTMAFNKLCDITDLKGVWLGTEDKKLYELQTSANGEVGYTTATAVCVHPSKAALLRKNVQSTSCLNKVALNTSTSSAESVKQSHSPPVGEYKAPLQRKRNAKCSTKAAVTMVTTAHVSTKNAAKICNELSKEGINIATPTQAGIHKAMIKAALNLEKNYKNSLRDDIWCIHFDGKKFGKKEVQVVVLTNETKEVRVAAMVLENGKSLSIFEGIRNVLDKFNLWNSIKMIVSDTTNVNTGVKSGVVRLLQNCFQEKHLSTPQYIGCQHHVLDLILKHVMNEVLGGKSTSPNISYDIFTELYLSCT